MHLPLAPTYVEIATFFYLCRLDFAGEIVPSPGVPPELTPCSLYASVCM